MWDELPGSLVVHMAEICKCRNKTVVLSRSPTPGPSSGRISCSSGILVSACTASHRRPPMAWTGMAYTGWHGLGILHIRGAPTCIWHLPPRTLCRTVCMEEICAACNNTCRLSLKRCVAQRAKVGSRSGSLPHRAHMEGTSNRSTSTCVPDALLLTTASKPPG